MGVLTMMLIIYGCVMLISARYHRAGGERHQDRGSAFRRWRGAQRVAAGRVSLPAAQPDTAHCSRYLTNNA